MSLRGPGTFDEGAGDEAISLNEQKTILCLHNDE
jgi:hypothetical protein